MAGGRWKRGDIEFESKQLEGGAKFQCISLEGGKISVHRIGGGNVVCDYTVGHVLSASNFQNSTAPTP